MSFRDQYRGARAMAYDRRWARYTQATHAPVLAAALPLLRPGMRVLDAGCGTGILLEALLVQQPELTAIGMDASPDMAAQARARLGDRAEILVGDLADPALPAIAPHALFDLILCTNVLHYLPSPAETALQLSKRLTPAGILIVEDFIAHGWWWPLFERIIRANDEAHRRTLSLDELRATADHAGLMVRSFQTFAAGGPWRGGIVAIGKGGSMS
jgi:SAM-dependent methyltransferase